MALADVAVLAGRIAFAAVVGYLALGNLLDREGAVAYARSKGAPFAGVTVPLGSLGLVAAAVSVALGIYPRLGVLAIVAILGPITVLMHDFWALEGQDAQNERIHFLKNAGLVGAALVLLAVPPSGWPFALGLAL